MSEFKGNTMDAYEWSKAFCQIASRPHGNDRRIGFDPTNADDQDWLRSWFANAIVHAYDRGLAKSKKDNQHAV